MLVIHAVTAVFASMLPETKGMQLGKVTEEEVPTDHQEFKTGRSMELI